MFLEAGFVAIPAYMIVECYLIFSSYVVCDNPLLDIN